MSDIEDAIPLRRANGVRGMARLESEITHTENALYEFAQSSASDAGFRLVAREGYLLGLQRALRWIRQERAK